MSWWHSAPSLDVPAEAENQCISSAKFKDGDYVYLKTNPSQKFKIDDCVGKGQNGILSYSVKTRDGKFTTGQSMYSENDLEKEQSGGKRRKSRRKKQKKRNTRHRRL